MWNPFGDFCALATLIILEMILGLDNFLFISKKLAGLPKQGLQLTRLRLAAVSLLMRWFLLWALLRLIHCQIVFFRVDSLAVTLRELVLVCGGIFLFCKCIAQPLNFDEVQTGVKASTPRVSSAKSISARSAAPVLGELPKSLSALIALTAVDSLCSVDSILAAVALSEKLVMILLSLIVAEFLMLYFHDRVDRAMVAHKSACLYANIFVAFLGVILVFRGAGIALPNELIYTGMGVLLIAQLYRVIVATVRDPLKIKLASQFLPVPGSRRITHQRRFAEFGGSPAGRVADDQPDVLRGLEGARCSMCETAFGETSICCAECQFLQGGLVGYDFGVAEYDFGTRSGS